MDKDVIKLMGSLYDSWPAILGALLAQPPGNWLKITRTLRFARLADNTLIARVGGNVESSRYYVEDPGQLYTGKLAQLIAEREPQEVAEVEAPESG